MSETAVRPAAAQKEDPFRYGWRYVRNPAPDGPMLQIPLTLEDVLHPQEDDFHMQRQGHFEDVTYLYTVFKNRFADEPRRVVLADMRHELDPDPNNHVGLGPDVAVILDAPKPHRNLGTYKVGVHGPTPDLVIEIVSPDTRVNDFGPKVQEYFDAGIPNYVIIDCRASDTWWHLSIIPFRRGSRKYEPRPLDAQGRYPLPEPYRILLGEREGRVVCWDAVTGEVIPEYPELARMHAIAQARGERESAAREKAEDARDAEREARRLAEKAKLDAEKAKLDAEARLRAESAARAAAEAQAESESAARAAAEARAAELERLLNDLQSRRTGG